MKVFLFDKGINEPVFDVVSVDQRNIKGVTKILLAVLLIVHDGVLSVSAKWSFYVVKLIYFIEYAIWYFV